MPKSSSKKIAKPFSRMNADELAAATAEFDRPAPGALQIRRAPGREKARLARAMARPNGAGGAIGRPIVGEGAERINITVERGLLKDADNFADAHGMTRSQLIAEGLRLAMARAV